MYLKQISSGNMIEVLTPKELFDPFRASVVGRCHYGEEAQDPEHFEKSDLIFLSDEPLPRCWTDSHYRDDELLRDDPP